jgi:hypothetical protein
MRSDWLPRRDLRSWCTIAVHQGSTTPREALPHASPDQLPPRLAPGLRCPHWLERRHLSWDWPCYLRSAQWSEVVHPEHQNSAASVCALVTLVATATMRFDRIVPDAAALILPLGFARHTRHCGWVSRAGLGGAERIRGSGLARLPLFPWPKNCGTDHALHACISCLDLRLVSTHRHRRQCHLLFRDFRSARPPGGPPPLSNQLTG